VSLNAGTVYATLGGQFRPDAFARFDSAMRRAEAGSTRFGNAFEKQAQRSNRAAAALGNAAKTGLYGGVLAAGAGLTFAVKKAADFESQLSSLGAVTKANAKDMAALRKQAMDMGAATKFSALEAAAAQTELAKGGLTTQQILEGGLKGALALAAAGEMDLALAASTTANALNLFGLKGTEAEHVADALAMAANATTADVSDFAMALTQGGSAAKAAGMSFDQTIVALEALAKAGVKGSDAGTSLKAMMTQVAKPSEESAAAMKKVGLSFFDAKGEFKDLAVLSRDLGAAFKGKTKEEKLALATTIAGTDGQRALLSILNTAPATLSKYADGVAEQGTAADVAAEKQDNLKGKIENLKGSLETAAITVGTELIPVLTDGAEKLTNFVNRAAASGDITEFGQDVAHGLEKVITFAPRAAGAIGDVAGAGADAYGAIAPLIDLIGHIPTEALIGAAAGILGLQVAATVAPAVIALTGAVSHLVLAARVGGISLFVTELMAMANPMVAAGIAAAGLGAAIGLLIAQESHEEQMARRVAEAKREQKRAIDDLAASENSAADAGLRAQRADLEHDRALKNLRQLRKDGKKGTLEYRDALLRVKETAAEAQHAEEGLNSELGKQQQAQKGVSRAANERLKSAADELKAAEDQVATYKKLHPGAKLTEDDLGRLRTAQREYNEALDNFRSSSDRAGISALNRIRAEQGAEAITGKNRRGVQALGSVLAALPKKVTTKLIGQDQDILAKLGRTSASLRAYGREKAVAKILADSATAEEALRRTKALLDRIQSKQITLTTVERTVKQVEHAGGTPRQQGGPRARAAGRGDVGPERALIGEGAGPEYRINAETGEGYVTSGPELANLAREDYVVPTEPRFRGRALGLFAQLARDLGVQAFRPGRPGKTSKPALKVPSKLDPLRLPVDRLEKVETEARNKYSAERDLDDDLKRAQASERDVARRKVKTKAQRDNKADDLRRARDKVKSLKKRLAKVPALRKEWQQRKKELVDARSYQAQITKQEDLADIARNDMELASRRKDAKAWEEARGRRAAAIAERRRLLGDALEHVKDREYQRDLQKDIGQLDIDAEDTKADTFAADAPAGLVTVTPKLEKDLALAELTETLDDDRSVLGRIEQFQGELLSGLQSGGGSAEDIRDAARALGDTRDRLKNLTAPTGGGADADLQAQLDRERERRQVAERERDVNAGALSVLGPAGGGSGAGGITNNWNIQTLHPGDPALLREIGDAATRGQSLQPSRGSSTTRLGV
jgi:TP901 family phage tail tape measure protein